MINVYPTVSVILPTYNRAHVVGRAIRSVLEQTYEDFELIVVDDGSTDGTEEVVRSFDDPRIRYIRHAQNRGGAAARNTGIRAARGEYIAFQDSDDEWLPEKLEKQMRIFENSSPDVGVVYTAFYLNKNNMKIRIPSSKITITDGNIHCELLKGNFVSTPTAVIRKNCFERAGMFDECLPRFQDWELFIRLSSLYLFRYIDEVLVNAFYSLDSISANNDALLKAYNLILDKHIYSFRKDISALAEIQYNIGNHLCQAGHLHEGRVHLLQAVRLSPLNLKYTVAAVSSLFGETTYATAVRLKRIIRPVNTGPK